MAFVAMYEGEMFIKEISESILESRCRFEKERNTYNSVPVFNTLDECIKSLNTYTKEAILPNGKTLIPIEYNYPEYVEVLKPVRFPIFEY